MDKTFSVKMSYPTALAPVAQLKRTTFRLGETSPNPRIFKLRDTGDTLYPRLFLLQSGNVDVDVIADVCYTIDMKDNLIHGRTCVYNINYHLVWSVKYRRKVLDENVEPDLKKIAMEVAEEKGFTLHLIEVGEMDHVHCFLSAPPKLSVTYIVKMLKGITGRKLFELHPELRPKLWKGELWNHSYYVETVGSTSEENIKRYLENQTKGY